MSIWERITALSWKEVFFAALAAYAIWFFVDKLILVAKTRNNGAKTWGQVDMEQILARCHEMFPIDTVSFGDAEFKSGMQVRITTVKKNTFEGQLIGKNKIDMICVLTNNQIIAQRMEKIIQIQKV